jgi:predicted TIM-barrel fold metal-dependent hydrolase
MKNGFRVMDCDAHVMEPDEMWVDYIEAAYRDRAPRRVATNGHSWAQMHVDGQPIYINYPGELVAAFQDRIIKGYGDGFRNGFDAASHVRAMDQQGVDLAYLYPSLGLGVIAIDGQDAGLAYAINRAYNNWLVDFCSYAPERLRPVAMISMHRPEGATEELLRVVNELRISAITIRPNPANGRTISHMDFEPFWKACEENNVAVGIHEGCHTRLPAAGADRFTTHVGMHGCCHPMEQMMAFVSLFEGGVFQRHPGLRVAFLESGCGWVPYLLWRMEEEFRLWRFQIPEVKDGPTKCFRRQCFVSAEGCEPYLSAILDVVGEDRILFATDYPHPDHHQGEEIEDIFAANLSDKVMGKILWNNGARFYNIEQSVAVPESA